MPITRRNNQFDDFYPFDELSPDRTGATDVSDKLLAAQVKAALYGAPAIGYRAGTYLLGASGTLEIPSNVAHVAQRKGSVIFKVNGALAIASSLFENDTVPNDLTTRTNTDIAFVGIVFDGAARTYPAYPNAGYNTLAPLLLLSKVIRPVVRGCRFVNHNNTCIQIDGCLDARIHDNDFEGWGTPYWISQAIRNQASGQRERIIGITKHATETVITFDASPPAGWANTTRYIRGVRGMTELVDGAYSFGAISSNTIKLLLNTTGWGDFIFTGTALVTSGNYMEDVGASILNNRFRSGNRGAIDIGGTDVEVAGNVVDGAKEQGFRVAQSMGANIHDNVIKNIDLADITGGCIEASYSTGVRIHHNRLEECDSAAVTIHPGVQFDFTDNVIKNPFKRPALTYPLNHGTDPDLVGDPLTYKDRLGIVLSSNDEITKGSRICNNRFILDRDGIDVLTAIGAVVSGGDTALQHIIMEGNDLTQWPVRRMLIPSSVAVAPVVGETLTGGTSGATGVVLWYESGAGNFVLLKNVTGQFVHGETVTGSTAASLVARSWDFDGNLTLQGSGVALDYSLRSKNNYGHVSERPTVRLYTSIGTGVKYFDLGFTPSAIELEARITSTTLVRQNRTWITNPRTGNANHAFVRSLASIDATGTLAADQVVTMRANILSANTAIRMLTAGNTPVNTASFNLWTPYGFALQWTLHDEAVNLMITAFP